MKQGYWATWQEFDLDNFVTRSWTGCSECKESILFNAKGEKVFTPYCPHCGIPMNKKKALLIISKGVCPCVQLSIFDEEKKKETI